MMSLATTSPFSLKRGRRWILPSAPMQTCGATSTGLAYVPAMAPMLDKENVEPCRSSGGSLFCCAKDTTLCEVLEEHFVTGRKRPLKLEGYLNDAAPLAVLNVRHDEAGRRVDGNGNVVRGEEGHYCVHGERYFALLKYLRFPTLRASS